MDAARRLLLKSATSAGLVAAAIAGGLLTPGRVLAREWNAAAFAAKQTDQALAAIDAHDATSAAELEVKAPDIAENGAVVPVEIMTRLPDVRKIAVLGEKNVYPLVALYAVSDFDGMLSTRIKMGQTSNVRVVVWSGDKTYTATKTVKVNVGGCG